jgi:hypothetical protein
MTLTIVGLGPGDVDDLSRRAWRTLKNAKTVYLRTAQHGCVACLPQTETAYISFDDLYETIDRFEDVYTAIVGRVLEAVQPSGQRPCQTAARCWKPSTIRWQTARPTRRSTRKSPARSASPKSSR